MFREIDYEKHILVGTPLGGNDWDETFRIILEKL